MFRSLKELNNKVEIFENCSPHHLNSLIKCKLAYLHFFEKKN